MDGFLYDAASKEDATLAIVNGQQPTKTVLDILTNSENKIDVKCCDKMEGEEFTIMFVYLLIRQAFFDCL